MSDPRAGLPSASSFATDVACPGRRKLLATLPNIIDLADEESLRGTRLHEAWMKEDSSGLQDDSEVEDYNAGLSHTQSLCEQWGEEVLCFPAELPREERLWLHGKTLEPVLSGQLDRQYRADTSILILDYKSGYSTYVPPAFKSWQLRVYAVLAYRTYDNVKSIRVGFVKPKLKAEPVDYCDYSEADLEQSEQAIFYHLWASQQEDAPRIPGPHCRYCPAAAAAACPEAGAFSLLPSVIAKNPSGTQDIEERVNSLAPNDLARIYQAKPIITAILQAVTDRLKGMTDEQLAVFGYKHQPRNPQEIVQCKAAYDRLRQEGVPEEQLWDLISIGKTELTKELQRQFGWSAEKARGWIKGQLAAFMVNKPQDRIVKL